MAARSRDDTTSPELKAFDSVAHDPIDEWAPDDDRVLYELTLHIGEVGCEPCDLWRVIVCTPRGLAQGKQNGLRFGSTPPIIVEPYLWEAVIDEVEQRIQQCQGYGWIDVQEKLRRQFHWEYEGWS